MQRESYELLAESTSNTSECLSKILVFLFSDENIFIDQKFRKLLRASPKGYIHSDKLIEFALIDNFFSNIGVNSKEDKYFLIGKAVKNYCDFLYYNLNSVRRVVPFNM